ncbi:MAG: hypothetical protein ACR2ME_00075 [Acidimicrobiia bacterium]
MLDAQQGPYSDSKAGRTISATSDATADAAASSPAITETTLLPTLENRGADTVGRVYRGQSVICGRFDRGEDLHSKVGRMGGGGRHQGFPKLGGLRVEDQAAGDEAVEHGLGAHTAD